MKTDLRTLPHARHVLAAAVLAAVSAAFATPAVAQSGTLPPPPYEVHVNTSVIVGLVWNEAILRKLLPAGIKPAADMSGGIGIYKSDRGYGLSPYDSVYLFANIEGFDSTAGAKGRFLLQGAYGPDEKIPAMLRTTYGWPLRTASVTFSETVQGKRAIARVAGRDVLELEIKLNATPCDPIAGANNYVGVLGGKAVQNQIPFQGFWCAGEPVAVNLLAPADDPIAAYFPAKAVWAGEFRDGTFAFTRPVTK